jgi:hypothetical protein
VVMKERYRADGAGRYSARPTGAEWAKHPGSPLTPGHGGQVPDPADIFG